MKFAIYLYGDVDAAATFCDIYEGDENLPLDEIAARYLVPAFATVLYRLKDRDSETTPRPDSQ